MGPVSALLEPSSAPGLGSVSQSAYPTAVICTAASAHGGRARRGQMQRTAGTAGAAHGGDSVCRGRRR
jgi:hypothetical protein